jgi:hypothetical protein
MSRDNLDQGRINSADSQLLRLPPEIRQNILKCLLYSSRPISLAKPGRRRDQTPFGPFIPLFPSVLQTCRQLHDAGEPILNSNTAGISWAGAIAKDGVFQSVCQRLTKVHVLIYVDAGNYRTNQGGHLQDRRSHTGVSQMARSDHNDEVEAENGKCRRERGRLAACRAIDDSPP